MIWHSMQAVIVIILLIGVGVFVACRKWVTRDVAAVFSRLVINVTLPCTLIYNLASQISREQLLDAWFPLLVAVFVISGSYFIARLFAGVFRIPPTRRGVFTVLFSFSNSVFIGFPVAYALFGDAGMPYAVFYFLVNTSFFWLLGYYGIRKDAEALSGTTSRVTAGELARKLATPPIITVLVMFILIFAGVKLPGVVLTTAKYLGDVTTPLSLIFTGCMIAYMGPKGMKYDKGVLQVLLGRYIIVPGLCFGACVLAMRLVSPQGPTAGLVLMRNVFTVQTGLPAMIQTAIVAELYGADVEYATRNLFWTTLVSLVTIPAYMLLFQYV